jgi:hypothetical protein
MYDTLLWACKILSLQFHTISATSQAILLLFVGSGASCRDGSYHVMSRSRYFKLRASMGMGYTLDLWPFMPFSLANLFIFMGFYGVRFQISSYQPAHQAGCAAAASRCCLNSFTTRVTRVPPAGYVWSFHKLPATTRHQGVHTLELSWHCLKVSIHPNDILWYIYIYIHNPHVLFPILEY